MKNKLHYYLTALSPPKPSDLINSKSKTKEAASKSLSTYYERSFSKERSSKISTPSTLSNRDAKQSKDDLVKIVVDLAEKIKNLTVLNSSLMDEREALKAKVENFGQRIQAETKQLDHLEDELAYFKKTKALQKTLDLAELSMTSQNTMNTSFKSEVCRILFEENEGINPINTGNLVVTRKKAEKQRGSLVNPGVQTDSKCQEDSLRRDEPRCHSYDKRKEANIRANEREFFSDRKMKKKPAFNEKYREEMRKENVPPGGLRNPESAKIVAAVFEERIAVLKAENEKIVKIKDILLAERSSIEKENKDQLETTTKELLEKMKTISNSPTLEKQRCVISDLKARLDFVKEENVKLGGQVSNPEGKCFKKSKKRYKEERTTDTSAQHKQNQLPILEERHKNLDKELEELKRKYWNYEKIFQYDTLMKNELRFSDTDLRSRIAELSQRHKSNINNLQGKILLNQEEKEKYSSEKLK